MIEMASQWALGCFVICVLFSVVLGLIFFFTEEYFRDIREALAEVIGIIIIAVFVFVCVFVVTFQVGGATKYMLGIK